MTARLAVPLLLIGAAIAPRPPELLPVSVYIAVTDAAETPVTDLAADDFEVIAGGRIVPVKLSLVTPERSTLVVLLDTTNSVPFWPLPLDSIETALAEGLQNGSSGRLLIHGVAGPFSATPLPTRFNVRDLSELFRSIQSQPKEPSPIWDAAIGSIETARRGDTNPIALLMMTDGRATGNRCSVNDAMRVAVHLGASISVLRFGGPTVIRSEGQNMVMVDAGRILNQVTATTGGVYIPAIFRRLPITPTSSLKDYREAIVRQAAQTLARWVDYTRGRYRLQLELPGATTVQPLTVRAKRPGITLHAASGYLTAGDHGRCLTDR